MAHQQEEGWPLGLRLGNARMGLVRNGDFSAGSVSFSTMLTGSTTPSTDSSSDLDTQSTGSFFHDRRSITLGSLIGISSFLQLSRRSTRGRMVMTEIPSKDHNNNKNNKNHKLIKPWLFLSLCSRLNTDAVIVHDNDNDDAPSLGQYLEAERRRRASSTSTPHNHHRIRRTHQYDDETIYGPNDFSPIQESNSLFVEGQVAAHQSENREWEQSNDRYGAPIVFSCLCG